MTEGTPLPTEATNATQVDPAQKPRYDAAIVLGKNIGIGWHRDQIQASPTHLSDHSRINVLAAGMMYKSGEAGKILFSSGPTAGEGIPSEAQLMKDQLQRIWPSIPDKDIILEDKSTQTKENAVEVRRILDQRPELQKNALVTVGFHVNRSKKLFDRAGVNAVPHASEAIVGKVFPKFAERYKRSKAYIVESLKEKLGTPVQLYAGALAAGVEKYVRRSRS